MSKPAKRQPKREIVENPFSVPGAARAAHAAQRNGCIVHHAIIDEEMPCVGIEITTPSGKRTEVTFHPEHEAQGPARVIAALGE